MNFIFHQQGAVTQGMARMLTVLLGGKRYLYDEYKKEKE